MVVAEVAGQRWSGQVAEVDVDLESGAVTATLVDDWIWLRYMLAAQTGALPITQTMAQYDSQTGNAATVAAYYINAAAARLAVPVAAVVPLTDDSAGITVNARMDPLADLLHDQLDAAAVALPARVWLPGDDQPTNMRLDRPTILFTPQQVPAKPWLTWTDTSGGIVKGTLKVKTATGYRAALGLDTPTSDDPSTRNYDQFIDTDLAAQLGDYAPPEVYLDASDATLGAASQARGRQEITTRRPSAAAGITVIDGDPHFFGRDYTVGDLPQLEVIGTTFTERITRVTVSDSRDGGLTTTPVIGDPTVAAAPDEIIVDVLADMGERLHIVEARG
jgi:hypothetical protein